MLCSLATVYAQQSYTFELIDVNDGLSHGAVNAILKDKQGFMWFGTSSGLNLYDGYSIKTFDYDPRDSSSLTSSEVLNFFAGPEGNLWISTVNGLNIYEYESQSFTRNLSPYYSRYNLPEGTVENIIRAGDEQFWFITTNQGITSYNPDSGVSKRLGTTNTDYQISSDNVSTIGKGKQGIIWVLHKNGLIDKIDAQSVSIINTYSGIYDRFDGQSQNYELIVDADGDLWIYTADSPEGIFYFDSTTEKFTQYSETSQGIKLNNNFVIAAVEANKGEIWIGTDHGGLNIIDKKTETVEYVLHRPEVDNGLVHNSIYSLYRDNEGIVWVGTYKNGINYYHPRLRRFEHYKSTSWNNYGLPFDDVNRFVEDEKGNLWIGTNGGGLLYFDRKKNSYKQYLADSDDPNSLSSNVIVSLSLDKSGNLWVGTYIGGLDRFDGNKFEHFRNDPSDSKSISGNNIWELFKDSRGELWISTLSSGLDRLDPNGKTFSHIFLSETITDTTLTANFIYEIEEDKNGDLWIAGGGGIDIVDYKTEKVNINKPEELDGLLENTVTSLHKDNKGRMWIGSKEGLYVYQFDKGLRLFTTNNGLPHNAILTIVEDQEQNLWLSTPNGISNVIIEESDGMLAPQFINYDETDGLQGKTFNENAALHLHSGEIVFGGPNGFNIFDPNNLSPNQNIPEIVFTDFQLFNKSLKVGEQRKGRVILDSNLNSLDELILKYNENVFSIEFAALNFLHPQKNEYKYKLEGFDEEWRTADLTRKVTYTNLDAGDYTFKVIASNNDDVWNESGISIAISIMPPFYASNFAYAIYLLLGLFTLYITRRMILAKERVRYQIEQERREAKQMHELDLLKIRFLTNISHEFRTPLSLILAPLDKLIGNSPKEDQKQFVMIKRNAKRLLNLVNQLLDFRKLEVDTIELNKSEGNIIKFIDESVHSFADLSENKKVGLSFNADREELYASFDMDKLEKILFNLLSNAFKFTPEGGRIDVTVRCLCLEEAIQPEKFVEIMIKDTGIGIPFNKQSKIFDRFFRNDTPGSVVNQGSGIGLSITKEFVKIHGGKIELESEPGKGSCFKVTLPVKELRVPEFIEPSKVERYERVFEFSKELKEETTFENETATLLLVEDNEDFRFYLKDNLGVHFKVTDAKNGQEGWQKCLSVLPDLIVSDLAMPELNGIDLCNKVKGDVRTSHIPFILLTADTKDESKLKGINTGADDYVTKPFNFEILLSRINNLIAQHKTMQETYSRKITIETSQADITSLNDQLIQDAIRIVEENISNSDFSVEMLSHELGMSRAHLYKKMVSLTGMSPLEFIRKIRLQRAAQFLKKSQLTIAEVAYKVGFNNRKYFSKYFKQEYNMLPSAFASEQNN